MLSNRTPIGVTMDGHDSLCCHETGGRLVLALDRHAGDMPVIKSRMSYGSMLMVDGRKIGMIVVIIMLKYIT